MADTSPSTPSTMRKTAPWAVPVGVGAIIAGIAFLPSLAFGNTSTKLAPKSAGELLAAVQESKLTAISGTIVETARLGIPDLPDTRGQSDLLSIPSLLTGSHTMRVWVDGPQKQRIALLGTLSEADIVHNGDQLWSYSSRGMAVTHETIKHDGDETPGVPLSTDQFVPQQAAQQALKALDPSTKVTVDHNTVVAGRATYTLTLQPRDTRSTIKRVALSIDGATGVPLRVQIFGSSAAPAFETGFTDVSFSKPAASVFQFTPPAGSTTQEGNPFSFRGFGGLGAGPQPGDQVRITQHGKTRIATVAPDGSLALPSGDAGAGITVQKLPGQIKGLTSSTKEIGTGWTTVVELVGDDHGIGGLIASISEPRADGSRLLQSSVLNALLTKDGKVFIGAVTPELLTHVAAAAR